MPKHNQVSNENFTILNSNDFDLTQSEHHDDNWNRIIKDNNGDIIIYGLSVQNNSETINSDIFIIKLSPNGEILWSYRYGGSGNDRIGSKPILIDSENNILIYGTSNSKDLPVKNSIYEPNFKESESIPFIIKFDPNGDLLFSMQKCFAISLQYLIIKISFG